MRGNIPSISKVFRASVPYMKLINRSRQFGKVDNALDNFILLKMIFILNSNPIRLSF